MSAFLKKQGAGFYFQALAAVVAAAAMITMVISSNISIAEALNSLSMYLLEAAAGIVLILVAVYSSNRFGNYDYISTIAMMAAVGLFAAVICGMILSRILLISGLFSWNSMNTAGWKVFYVSVASMVYNVVSIILLIISAFLKTVK